MDLKLVRCCICQLNDTLTPRIEAKVVVDPLLWWLVYSSGCVVGEIWSEMTSRWKNKRGKLKIVRVCAVRTMKEDSWGMRRKRDRNATRQEDS
ncbi:hypothetical protein ACFXTN_035100 [Malus domestica]